MKGKVSRVLSVFTAVILCLSILPADAFAAQPDEGLVLTGGAVSETETESVSETETEAETVSETVTETVIETETETETASETETESESESEDVLLYGGGSGTDLGSYSIYFGGMHSITYDSSMAGYLYAFFMNGIKYSQFDIRGNIFGDASSSGGDVDLNWDGRWDLTVKLDSTDNTITIDRLKGLEYMRAAWSEQVIQPVALNDLALSHIPDDVNYYSRLQFYYNPDYYIVYVDPAGGAFMDGTTDPVVIAVEEGSTLLRYNSSNASPYLDILEEDYGCFRDGYTLMGVSTTENDTGGGTSPRMYKPEADEYLYLQWAKIVRMTFYANGGRFIAHDNSGETLRLERLAGTYVFSSTDGIEVCREGYAFKGYSTDKAGTKMITPAGSTDGTPYYLVPDANVTWYAQWKAADSLTIKPYQGWYKPYYIGETTRPMYVIASGPGPLKYQWQFKAAGASAYVNVSGATSSSYQFVMSDEKSGLYRCRVTDANGKKGFTDDFELLAMHAISKHAADYTGPAGSTARFSVTANGALSYVWQVSKDGDEYQSASVISGAKGVKTASLTFPVTETWDGCYVKCIVSFGENTDESVARLHVGKAISTAALTLSRQPAAGIKLANVSVSGVETDRYTCLENKWTYTLWSAEVVDQWNFDQKSETDVYRREKFEKNCCYFLHVELAANNGCGFNEATKVTVNGKALDASSYCVYTSSGGYTGLSIYIPFDLYQPVIQTQPSPVTAAAGKDAVFTVKASGSGLSYQWQYRTSSSGSWQNATATGNKTAKLTVPGTVGRNGYQYRCQVKNAGGTTNSTAVTLKIRPGITVQPAGQTVAAGKNAVFSVTAQGPGTLTYQWQYRTSSTGSWQNATATGNKTAKMTVPGTVGRNGYQYRCQVKNANGTTNSNAVTLKIRPGITAQPASQTVAAGKNAVFSVTAQGPGTLTYQWQYRTSATGTWQNATATGNKTAKLTVPGTAGRNGYQYRCQVKNANGTTNSNAAKLTVK